MNFQSDDWKESGDRGKRSRTGVALNHRCGFHGVNLEPTKKRRGMGLDGRRVRTADRESSGRSVDQLDDFFETFRKKKMQTLGKQPQRKDHPQRAAFYRAAVGNGDGILATVESRWRKKERKARSGMDS